MPSLFQRPRSSFSSPSDPSHPTAQPTISSSIYNTAQPASASPAPLHPPSTSADAPDLEMNGQRRGSLSGGSKMDTLKAKLAVGKSKGISFLHTGSSSLNVSTDANDMGASAAAKGAGGRRGSLGGYRMGGGASASTTAFNENSVRRGSVSGTAITSTPGAGPPPPRFSRQSLNLLDADDPPLSAGANTSVLDQDHPTAPAFATMWKPMQPERKVDGVNRSTNGSESPIRNTTSTTAFTQPQRNHTPPPASDPVPKGEDLPLPESSMLRSAPRSLASTPSPPATSPGLRTDRQSPRGPRPTPGRIAMPPPPSLVSRKSTMGNNGRLTGLSIVPSTPVPRPIANLPTLNGSASGGPSRRSFDDHGFGGSATPKSATPVMSRESSRDGGASANTVPSGQSSAGLGGSTGLRTPTVGSPIRGMSTASAQMDLRVGSSPLGMPSGIDRQAVRRPEARRQRSIMPVMLREPSQRVIHPVDDGGNVGESDDDDDGDSDSSSPEASDNDGGDSSATETEEVPRRYGSSRGDGSLSAVGAKGLLAKTRRGSKGVRSIAEEGEGSAHVASGRDSQSGGMSDRRQAPLGGLGTLPGIPASPRQGSQDPSMWGLPTPKTPGPGLNSAWNFSNPPSPAAGWTQFGAQTPSIAPGPSPFRSAMSPVGNFTIPVGVAVAAAKAKAQQTPGIASDGNVSYFDAAPLPDLETAPASTSDEAPEVLGQASSIEVPEGSSSPTRHGDEPKQLGELSPRPIALPAPIASGDENLALGGALPPPPATTSLDFFEPEAGADATSTQTESEAGGVRSALDGGANNHIAIQTGSPESQWEEQSLHAIEPSTSADEISVSTPARPSPYSRVSRSAIDLHITEDDESDDRVDPAFVAAVRERMSFAGPVDPSSSTSREGSIESGTASTRPTPSRKSSALDWTLPPPTPGVGMKQPFHFSMATSPRVDSIKKPSRGSPSKLSQMDGGLTRRRSMNELKEAPPPDYIHPIGVTQAVIKPREEEGREPLPDYWCSVHIEGYLPRKMEFSTPGVQAKDRAWKRYYMILHGTSLSVYKHDPHKFPIRDAENIIAIDEADVDNLHVHLPGERRASIVNPVVANRRPSAEASGPVARRPSAAGLDGNSSTGPGARRSSNASMLSSSVSSVSTATSDKDASLFAYTADRSSAGPRRPSISIPPPQPDHKSAKELAVQLHIGGGNQLVKRYSLQNAESGLASDYKKRTNVVRVRVEGEQFLLHTEGPKDVVDWIEAFQAATNVSLDLDVRPMPKIITLPRRRRRRPAGEAGAQPASVAANDDTPEGNARAVAEAERAQRETRLNAMDRALAEDQAQG